MAKPRHAALLVAVAVAALTQPHVVAERAPSRGGRPPSSPPSGAQGKDGLSFRLSEAGEGVEERVAVPRPSAERLTEEATSRLLGRLPDLPETEGDEKPFALRGRSLPPPRTGRTVVGVFPPPAETVRPETPTGPLTVLRRAPEGDVPLAPHLSITFSQPMVAVTSQDAAAAVRPVELQPEPEGQWRWLGTRTLVFEPKGRFPMATAYRVAVPAETRALGGGALENVVTWGFTTPAPSVTARWPDPGPSRRDTPIAVAFDQRIEPARMLASLQVTGAGTRAELRLATAEEIEALPELRAFVERSGPDRVLVARTLSPLPADSAISVTVAAGAPSAEGLRTTTAPQRSSFRTYGAVRVRDHRCGWNKQCPPMTPWMIDLTNPIDTAAFREDMVKVEPDLPGLRVDVFGPSLQIRGRSKGRTTYRVSLDASLPDVFGQTLGDEASVVFRVGEAPPLLGSAGGPLVVLDPAAGPRFSVFTVNEPALKVTLHAVTPDDWPAFLAYRMAAQRNEATARIPGRQVLAKTVSVMAAPDERVETPIDLSQAFRSGLGHAVLVVEETTPRKEPWQRHSVRTWIEATRIGLDAFVDRERIVALATELATGRPLADVEIISVGTKEAARTGADGLASVPLGPAAVPALVARRGDDSALVPQSLYPWGPQGWTRQTPGSAVRFFAADDRGMYRPGEEVRLKGFARVVGEGPKGDVEWTSGAVTDVAWTLRDSRNNEVGRGEAAVGPLGGFDVAVKLPDAINLGPARFQLEARGSRASGPAGGHQISIQEFRRPEFEVTAAADAGPHFVAGPAAIVTARAAYYAGGALGDTELRWQVTARPATYAPPNRGDFGFGRWKPWWRASVERGTERSLTLTTRTDGQGQHRLRIDFDSVHPPEPTSLVAEAQVQDVNRQAWTGTAALLVHPSSLYVGLKSERLFVRRGEDFVLQTIVTDLDGKAVSGRGVTVAAERLEWRLRGGRYVEEPVDHQECSSQSARDPVRCTLRAKEGGEWRITARVADEQGRPNESETHLWVAGGTAPPSRGVERQEVRLIPDRKEYAAGDTAELLVLAPFAPAEGVLTLDRDGIVRQERFRMDGASHTLRVPIDAAWTPNVHARVTLVGAAPRTDDAGQVDPKLPPRPAFATGDLDLSIPAKDRALALTVRAREAELEPGGTTEVALTVVDAKGHAVAGAEIAVAIVDEAVLALSGHRWGDPRDAFYATRRAFVTGGSLRAHVQLARPEDVAEGALAEDVVTAQAQVVAGLGYAGDMAVAKQEAAPRAKMALARAGGPPPPPPPAPQGVAPPPPIALRTDFRATAIFLPALTSGPDGTVRAEVKLPDSLTRYRIMVVAAAGERRFGAGEATLTSRLPIMVRPSPPRFLNFGDRFELPVVVQNQTSQELRVEVAVRARNASLTDGQGRAVRVPAHDRVEVRFPVAAERAGRARFQFAAASGRFTDAAEASLPVWTPATTEAFATYGEIDSGSIAQPVATPPGSVAGFGGLEVTTSSTAVSALTDAVLYLVAYPFECSEQLSSRILAIAALRDVLAAFRAEGLPPKEELAAAVDRDIARLRNLQDSDGGFAFWRRGDPSWPYVSIHAAHALARAKEKGFSVPDEMIARSKRHLADIEHHIPSWYSAESRRLLIAYALSVRQRLGDVDRERARKLLAEAGPDGLSFESMGFLLQVLSRDPGSEAEATILRRHFANRVSETAGAAHFTESYIDGAQVLLVSNRRSDAIVLDALITDQPKSDLIPKLVAGLLAHRTAGRWAGTQENAFVLLALDHYFNAFEKVTPDFVARAWLGDRLAGEHEFRGRTTDRFHVAIPMDALSSAKAPVDLTVAKDGPGRLYYRIGLRYAPASLNLEAADRGFTVVRRYESVDAKTDVTRAADGAWHVKAGARVRVRLTMVTPARRYHVALVDPLPAGLEALNPALKTTGTLPPTPASDVSVVGAPGLGGPRAMGAWWWWTRTWFEHQNLRDERVEAFSSLLWEGVWEYSYLARATTPGSFVVPPPKAEEMYSPETFGRGPTDRLIVE